MQEINIIGLLQKYSGEIVISATLACIVTLIGKRLIKFSNRWLIIISSVLGFIAYALISLFFLEDGILMLLANAITSAVLGATLALFTKKITIFEGEDIKKSLEKLLSSIVLSDKLDEVVDDIIEKIVGNKQLTKQGLKEIISDNLHATLDDEQLENVVSFIISSCGIEDNSNYEKQQTQENIDKSEEKKQ